MTRVRYRVAMSLDGYIAGPNGEFDWIVQDPTMDFGAVFAQFDTFLVGRRTFDIMRQPDSPPLPAGTKVFVFSRTLPPDTPGATVVRALSAPALAEIKEQAAKDIWVFGGGSLFRSLWQVGFVDTVEVAVIPVLLGGGLPLLPPPAPRRRLRLTGQQVHPSGIVTLEYAIAAQAPE